MDTLTISQETKLGVVYPQSHSLEELALEVKANQNSLTSVVQKVPMERRL